MISDDKLILIEDTVIERIIEQIKDLTGNQEHWDDIIDEFDFDEIMEIAKPMIEEAAKAIEDYFYIEVE